jgi:hypothetical protein
MAALAAVLVIMVVLVGQIQQSPQISTLNGSGNSIDIPLPTDKPRPKPTTLTVSPGRTSVLDTPIQNEPAKPKSPAPVPTSATGINWAGLLTAFGPPIIVAFLLWQFARRRAVGALEEVNLGVYKGALPFELHSATHKKYLFTRAMAHASLFGKTAADFLGRQPAVLQRRGQAALERVR